jgi:hypothetical protein
MHEHIAATRSHASSGVSDCLRAARQANSTLQSRLEELERSFCGAGHRKVVQRLSAACTCLMASLEKLECGRAPGRTE